MKRFTSIVLSLVIMLSITGCSSNKTKPNPSTETTPTIVTATPTPTNTPIDSKAISGEKLQTGVYKLDLNINSLTCSGILLKDKYLIMSGNTDNENWKIYVFDLHTGNPVATHDLGPGSLYGLDGDSFGYYLDNGKIYQFSDPLSSPKLILSPKEDEYGYSFLSDGSLYSMLDCKLSYRNQDVSKTFDLKYSDDISYISVSYIYDDYIYAVAQKKDYTSVMLKISISSGEVSVIDDYNSNYSYLLTDNSMLSKSYNRNKIFITNKSNPLANKRSISTVGISEYMLLASDKYVLTQISGENEKLAIYDVSNNMYYYDSPHKNPNSTLVSYSISGNKLCLFYNNYEENKPYYYYIDMSELSVIKRPETHPKYKEGITILTGQDAILDFNSFSAEPLTDESLIEASKATIEKMLAKFPEGFFDELLLSDKSLRNSLVICLTSKLIPESEYSVTSANGFAYMDNDAYYIALSISSSYHLTIPLYHELMHIIDNHLSDSVYNPYPDWNKYLPSKDCYFNSYRDSKGKDISDTKYTSYGYTNINNVWFATPYCRTYDIEDRAVMFEIMCTDSIYSDGGYYKKFPHIQARMRYLAEVIRNNFESVQKADKVLWE